MPVGIKLPGGAKWSYPTGQEKGARFTIEWDGDVGQMLQGALDRMSNYRPMLRLIGRQVVASSKQSFVNQRSPDGENWPPLKMTYTDKFGRKLTRLNARPPGHNQNPVVLFDSGELYKSIEYEVVADNAVAITWGPEYGKYHQYGAPRAHIPRRKFLGPTPGEIPETVRQWVGSLFTLAQNSALEGGGE